MKSEIKNQEIIKAIKKRLPDYKTFEKKVSESKFCFVSDNGFPALVGNFKGSWRDCGYAGNLYRMNFADVYDFYLKVINGNRKTNAPERLLDNLNVLDYVIYI